jgi:hypothetical protein
VEFSSPVDTIGEILGVAEAIRRRDTSPDHELDAKPTRKTTAPASWPRQTTRARRQKETKPAVEQEMSSEEEAEESWLQATPEPGLDLSASTNPHEEIARLKA